MFDIILEQASFAFLFAKVKRKWFTFSKNRVLRKDRARAKIDILLSISFPAGDARSHARAAYAHV